MNIAGAHCVQVGAVALECVGRRPAVDGSEPLFVGFSVRNRSFNRGFFESAGELALRAFSSLSVAILDIPYAFNDAAKRGDSTPSDAEIEKAIRIGDEREQMVRRVLNGIDGLQFTVRRWRQLENASVRSLRDELSHAIATDRTIRDLLTSYSAQWATSANEQLNNSMVGFQICELPVLLDLYYREGLLNDLYPGEVVDFFFRLERGDFSGSLPSASQFSRGRRLSCLRFASSLTDPEALAGLAS